MMNNYCFCGSKLNYEECCQKVHEDQKNADTAEQLMRARYSAFVLHNIDFLYKSFHPETRKYQNKVDIESWSKENYWQELKIIKSSIETVEFKAYYLNPQMELQIHHEKSRFKKYLGLWYYFDGKIKS